MAAGSAADLLRGRGVLRAFAGVFLGSPRSYEHQGQAEHDQQQAEDRGGSGGYPDEAQHGEEQTPRVGVLAGHATSEGVSWACSAARSLRAR